jgi:protocatechuate 3,4-dioxygenase beta subunit
MEMLKTVMKAISTFLFTFYLLPLTVYLFSCSTEQAAGPTSGSETGNAIVLGSVVDEDNQPVAGVEVRLYPINYNPLTDGPLPDSLVAYTDSNGHYILDAVDTGSYNFEATSAAKHARALQPEITVSGNSVTIPTKTLEPTGSILVTLPALPDNDTSYLYIPGTAIFVKIVPPQPATFQVMLDLIPPGTYLQLIYTKYSDLENPVVLAANFTVEPGQITFLVPDVDWGGPKKAAVEGTVVDAGGTPAALALVKLFPEDYNPLIEETQIGYRLMQTDNYGNYSFSEVDSGSYFLEAVNQSMTAFVCHALFTVSDTRVDLGTDTLRPTGSVLVPLPELQPGQTAFIYIPNSSYYQEVLFDDAASHQIVLEDVPAGLISEIMLTKNINRFNPVLLARDITVTPGRQFIVPPYSSWTYSASITLNTSASGAGISGDVLDFPLLIRLDSSRFDFSQADMTGGDIRFAKTDNRALYYQVEQWTGVSAAIWVKLDTVYADRSDQTFTMYWGRSGVSDRSTPHRVFGMENHFAAVWHLGESAAGVESDGLYKNSVADENHGNDMILADIPAVFIGGGTYMDIDDYIQVTHVTPVLKPDTTVMVSAWVNPVGTSPGGGDVLSMGDDYMLRVYSSDGNVQFWNYDEPATGDNNIVVSGNVNDSAWHHVVGIHTAENYKIYVDGVLAGTEPSPGSIKYDLNTNLTIGVHGNKKIDYSYGGFLDEIRVSTVERPAAWIKLCYESQKPGSAVVEISTP